MDHVCYQFRILRNLRIDIKDRLEEYSQSIEIDIHVCTQSQYKPIFSTQDDAIRTEIHRFSDHGLNYGPNLGK